MFEDVLSDWGLGESDKKYLLLIFLFSLVLVIYMVYFNNKLGIYCSDVFIFLLNTLNFSGNMIGSASTMYVSPFIPIITSILFAMGLEHEVILFLITGIFAMFGATGVYALLRIKMDELISLLGTILFISFSLNILWLANGTMDLPALCLMIWTIFSIYQAVNKHPEFYIMAALFFVFGFFTRYTTILILPPIILYLLIKYDFLKHLDEIIHQPSRIKNKINNTINSKTFTYIKKALFLGIIIATIFTVLILLSGSNLFFINQSAKAVVGTRGSITDNAYTTDTLFYITHLPSFLSATKTTITKNIPLLSQPSIISYIILTIISLGIITGLYNTIKRKYTQIKFKTKHFQPFLIIVTVISLISFTYTLGKLSSVLSIILLSITLSCLSKILSGYNIKDLNFHILLISWLTSYLIFFTFINIKVDRYIITILPVIAYTTTYSLKILYEKIKNKKITKTITIILILLFTISAISYTTTIPLQDDINAPRDISNWLKEYDPHYMDKNIGVYNIRPYRWYLKIKAIGITNNTENILEKENITYYISQENKTPPGYQIIHTQNHIYLYQKKKIPMEN